MQTSISPGPTQPFSLFTQFVEKLGAEWGLGDKAVQYYDTVIELKHYTSVGQSSPSLPPRFRSSLPQCQPSSLDYSSKWSGCGFISAGSTHIWLIWKCLVTTVEGHPTATQLPRAKLAYQGMAALASEREREREMLEW